MTIPIPTPLLVDCDPGIDDAVALLLACASPEVELLGVTTVGGNVGVEQTTRNARAILALAGRGEVPVAAGAARPLVRDQPRRAGHVHGQDGIGGVQLPVPAAAGPRSAVQLLADTVRRCPRPVTLVAIGPLTNVALFYALHPDLAAELDRLVWLGGSAGAGNVTPAAEFNAWTDPEAAYRVLTDPGLDRVPRTVQIGLDITRHTAVDADRLRQLRTGGAAAAAVADMLDHYLGHYRATLGRPAVVLHDAVAMAEVVRPGVIRTERRLVTVDYSDGPGRGAILVGPPPAAPEPPTPTEPAAQSEPADGRERDLPAPTASEFAVEVAVEVAAGTVIGLIVDRITSYAAQSS